MQKNYFTPRWWRPRERTNLGAVPTAHQIFEYHRQRCSHPAVSVRACAQTQTLCHSYKHFSKTMTTRRLSRCVRRLARRELQCRITKHLRDVERTHQAPRRSICLYIQVCNVGFPRNRPICSAILFGEEGYFFDDKTGTDPPPAGWCLTFTIKLEGGGGFLPIATGHQRIREPLGTSLRGKKNKPAPRSSAPASLHDWDSATPTEHGTNI